TTVNTFIIMSLTGIWHGASLNFLVWGMYHGIGLILLRIYGITIGNRLPEHWRNSKVSLVISTLLTFHFVVIGWIFFATDFDQSLYVISRMFNWG
ncbi:MAG TPA: MBOAT family protein, partial [Desulfobacteria bacterium]|nr:MBOAT family protein [Desulfobacteria bacterium]